MIPGFKLNFAAWTGLGITALFGGTGIYLVGNSQNLAKVKDAPKEKIQDPLINENRQGQEASFPNLSPKTASSELGPVPKEPALEESYNLPAEQAPDPDNQQQVTSDPNLSPESEPLADESASENVDSQGIETPSLQTKEERKDEEENSDIVHLTLDDNEDLQLP